MRIPHAFAAAAVALVSPGAAFADGKEFIHPGILHTQADFDFVREKIAAAAQPWLGEWQTLERSRIASLDHRPDAHADVERGPSNNPSIGADEFMFDAAAAYTHALHWTISGDKARAAKTIEILDDYAATLKTVGHHDARLLIGMGGIHFVAAAELIKHSDAGWPAERQKAFETLLREVLYPVIIDFYPSANGNWDASMIQTMIAMGVYLDDRAMFDRAADHFRAGEGNGCVTKYFKPTGQCQESGRDQAHTQMGLAYLASAAEIAWNQGVDLYGVADNLLAKGYEYTAKYNLGHDDVPYERYISFEKRYDYKRISDDSRGRFAPIYRIPFRHYHGRKGLEVPFTEEAIEKHRSRRRMKTNFTPWTELMFTR